MGSGQAEGEARLPQSVDDGPLERILEDLDQEEVVGARVVHKQLVREPEAA